MALMGLKTLVELMTLMAFKELMTLIMMMYQPASCREEETQALRWCARRNHPKPGDQDRILADEQHKQFLYLGVWAPWITILSMEY